MIAAMSLNGSKIIFVGGIHGVGKSTICETAAAQLGITHLIAGHLIREAKQIPVEAGKGVASVSANQDVLVEALSRKVLSGHPYLMDGHFALLTSAGRVERVPLSTFQSIAPLAAVVIVDDPAAIANRLASRDGKHYDISALESLQAEEEANARFVCSELGISLVIASPDQGVDRLMEVLKV